MPKMKSYFWFMTVQTSNGAGSRLNSYQGVVTPESGTTRLQLFNEVREEIDRLDPLSQGGCVIAFDMQPNEL
ncbi:hypothetical protein [Streptomyces sp. NPDC047939]|uniref:hypothetical protein n=1 Tax=Streptomyces sp. NPDC047939 TaxID=3155381 RepID=UPI003439BEC5